MPDYATKKHIFQIHTGRMKLAQDVDLELIVSSKDNLSGRPCPQRCISAPCRLVLWPCATVTMAAGADIKAICTEAGLLALRERRTRVEQEDFLTGKERVLDRKQSNLPVGLYL